MMKCLTYIMLWINVAQAAVAAPGESVELRRYDAPQAGQAVAVGPHAFYAIGNQVIAKYDRESGRQLATWQASEACPLIHLNSGVLHNSRLYCAHSNFPGYPNVSSVEIFDASTLQHVASHSFGIFEGSLTVVDWHDDAWWCVFAHYSQKVNSDSRAKPHHYTSLVKFDAGWRRTAGWVFPPEVLDRFAPHSCSGGGWGPDGAFWCTGHDRGECYRLALPQAGSVLRLIDTVQVPITGQGIAWDPNSQNSMFGIDRPARQVVVVQLPSSAAGASVEFQPTERTQP